MKDFLPVTYKRLHALHQEDLSFVTERLVWKEGYSEDMAKLAVEEYRKWIEVLVCSRDKWFKYNHGINPEPCTDMASKMVDDAWHGHILFTREYAEFCQNVNGRYIHHEPFRKGSSKITRKSDTEQIYTILFGPMPPIWQNKLKKNTSNIVSRFFGK